MSESRPGQLAGLAAVGLGVCCGLPVLLGALGALGAVAGLAVGSALVVAIGLVIGALGWMRWRRRRECPTEQEGR